KKQNSKKKKKNASVGYRGQLSLAILTKDAKKSISDRLCSSIFGVEYPIFMRQDASFPAGLW
ncbi:hypothetical protein, partial [Streptococcus suis]|uniref:hypothetical protein n=1 Tax=Streptococcus suis TaxID=1307 RepID=UPI001EE6C29A